MRSLRNGSGEAIHRYSYDAFGGKAGLSGQVCGAGNPVARVYGKEGDSETGLYYYRASYYDPKIGRFISKDPIGFAGGDVKVYRYVRNSPISCFLGRPIRALESQSA
ncbi:MAG: RHS repeat-associated core domain-containing protein [Deltaproteobacteria bacterium]|nr:RHS repeat-associated core domain-containing protein [Deltaproteobacteria bacterium]